MKLYVSGPMTGLPEFNYPAFHAAKGALEARGYEVISPADLPLRDDWEWIDYILVDVDSVFAADGIASLDGWEASKGARIEHRIGENRPMPIMPVGHWLDLAAETAVGPLGAVMPASADLPSGGQKNTDVSMAAPSGARCLPPSASGRASLHNAAPIREASDPGCLTANGGAAPENDRRPQPTLDGSALRAADRSTV